MSGHFQISREMQDHPVVGIHNPEWYAAWVWLVGEASWGDRRLNILGKTTLIKRGQVSHSLRFIADKLGWSKGKTERFIARLKNESMIETEAGTGQNVITICNYNKYQLIPGYDETPTETSTGTAPGQHRDSTGTAPGQHRDKEEYLKIPVIPLIPEIPEDEGRKGLAPDGATPHPPSPEIENSPDKKPTAACELLTLPDHLDRRGGADIRAAAVEDWNALAASVGLAKVQLLTKSRTAALRARLTESGGIEGWRAALARVRASPFLLGDNDRGWRADFDFVLKPKSFTKLMEGGFDDRKNSRGNRDGAANGNADRALAALARIFHETGGDDEHSNRDGPAG